MSSQIQHKNWDGGHFNKLHGNTIQCKLCNYLLGVRRFLMLLCHYQLRHPEAYKAIGSLERLREMYGIKFKRRVGYTMSYKNEPTSSNSRAPSPMTEFAVDPMRDVNTEAFRNEGYDNRMVQDEIELEDGIAEEWNGAVANELEKALLGITEEPEREGSPTPSIIKCM